MDKSYFYSWIFEFYKEKGVKYFITEKEVGNNNMSSDNFIIFPIEHFNRYFDVTAIYRKKKRRRYEKETSGMERRALSLQLGRAGRNIAARAAQGDARHGSGY